jgi:hypothetical protein
LSTQQDIEVHVLCLPRRQRGMRSGRPDRGNEDAKT